jgi:hypothetical protein
MECCVHYDKVPIVTTSTNEVLVVHFLCQLQTTPIGLPHASVCDYPVLILVPVRPGCYPYVSVGAESFSSLPLRIFRPRTEQGMRHGKTSLADKDFQLGQHSL